LSSYFWIKQAEDVIGSLLTEYLGSPQQHIAASQSNSVINDTSKNEDTMNCPENDGENMDSSMEKNDNGENEQPRDRSVDLPTCFGDEDIKGDSVYRVNKEADSNPDEHNEAAGEQNCGEASLINDEPTDATSADSLDHGKTCQDSSSIPNNNVLAASACQFRIVDPPRVGLHPTVSKF
jgi:tRNA (uracil-5-)-methyltransferase